jgi:hypothetical protein
MGLDSHLLTKYGESYIGALAFRTVIKQKHNVKQNEKQKGL